MANLNQRNEEMFVKIPKNLEHIKYRGAGLSRRQQIYIGIAAVLALITAFTAWNIAGGLPAVLSAVSIAMPFFALAFIRRDGMQLEELALLKIRFWIFPSHRKYRKQKPSTRPPQQARKEMIPNVTSNKTTPPKTNTAKPPTNGTKTTTSHKST